MVRTLYGKLVAALFALVATISLIYVGLTVTTTRLYLQEVNQKLNQTLAASIVAETPLLQGGAVDQAAFEGLFHSLMVINPSIELYLIDPEGVILSYNAPPGRVQRGRVSLAPIRAFIDGAEAFPIRGDDPRDPQGRKVFSAAELREGPRLAGYLYVVLGGEAFDSVARMIQDSYILRLAVGVGLASLALALIAGLVSFNWLTRRLRRLSAAVEAFKQGEFQAAMSLGPWRRGPRGDEIDELGITVEQMSQRIVDQIRQLRHADATRRELIANISHDLRTPLTSLQGYLETLLIKDTGATTQLFDALHGLGVGIALDDFGTGYSSLAYLKRFPIHTLKIDRTFIKDLPRDSDDAAIVTAVISLARGLGLNVVAEGVETAEQLRFLRSRSCDTVQGFIFSKPLPAEEMTQLLLEGKQFGPFELAAPNQTGGTAHREAFD
ncbi:MAG: EAL domain-containing protein [Proteobacteria bacterium]|nr:EAL domain-containing protein [Pseudomonadota bacterium]